MFFLIGLVLGFVVILILYGHYMNASGSISKRRIQVANLRDRVDLKIQKLNAGSSRIEKEISEATEQLEDLKRLLDNTENDENDL